MGIFAKIWNFLTGKKEVEEPVKQAKPANVKPIKKTAANPKLSEKIGEDWSYSASSK